MLLAPITLIMVEIYWKKQKMHRITSMEVSVLNEKRKYCNFKKMVCWSVLYASIISSDRTEDAHILTFILLIPCNLFRNPRKFCQWSPESRALESGIDLKEYRIQCLESGILGVESWIQDCLGLLHLFLLWNVSAQFTLSLRVKRFA